jgi:ketosteroid isomerase-like protein
MSMQEIRSNGAELRRSIDPRREPAAWIANNERITNEGDLAGWLALYAPDVVFEAITDGASDRIEGIERVTAAVEVMGELCKRHRLRVQKRFVAAMGDVIVNTWTGGFAGRERQFGVEIWTLRDDKVVRQEQYMFMDVRPARSATAKLRALFSGELAIKLALVTGRAARPELAR